jgi:hypothetical protein
MLAIFKYIHHKMSCFSLMAGFPLHGQLHG